MTDRILAMLGALILLLLTVDARHVQSAQSGRGARLDSNQAARIRAGITNALNFFKNTNYAQAEFEVRSALTLLERVKDQDYFIVRDARWLLGLVLMGQKKFAEAEREFRKLVPLDERHLGVGHIYTLEDRGLLARTLAAQGKHDAAVADFRSLLQQQERALGAAHTNAFTTRGLLAGSLGLQGKHGEAESELRALLPLQERLLGTAHRDTLFTRHNLALALVRQQKYAEAETLYKAASADMEQTFGDQDLSTLRVFADYAYCQAVMGKIPQARLRSWRALEGLRRILGPEHPETKRIGSLHSRLSQKPAATKGETALSPAK